jgi:Cu2+-exporting ATPase
MCCAGCQAVARAIVSAGHADFYRYRTGPSRTGEGLVPEFIRQAKVYDHPEIQKSFVRQEGQTVREASLVLEGIVCAACVWLNERHLSALPGILDVQINYATHRARVRWDDARIHLSGILQAIHAIGYRAHPYDPVRQQQLFEYERRAQLRRIGVAGILGMQVMILSVALYAGAWTGMEHAFEIFFGWLGLALTLPVLVYSAAPFFHGAWRDLRNRSVGMDVPVSLALLVAFLGSVQATWSGEGHVYYDSIVMFTFFLLFSRYFEIMARKRGAETMESLSLSVPAMATRLSGDTHTQREEVIPVAELQPGDRVLIRPGEAVPADGHLIAGKSSVDESLLTGESTAIRKTAGMQLIGGSINIDSPVQMVVDSVGADTMLAGIIRLLEDAQATRPAIAQLADRIASWFVGTVIVAAAVVALYWLHHAPGQWLAITISVLVVTCPCALSLATPTAISAAAGTLMASGMLTRRGNALETLARSSDFVFDKTGTLTRGQPALAAIHCAAGLSGRRALQIAAALEQHSEHTIARTIVRAACEAGIPEATDVANEPGAGLSGVIDGECYYIGAPSFIRRHTGQRVDRATGAKLVRTGATPVVLAERTRILCVFALRDELREGADEVVAALGTHGRSVFLMTGDHRNAATRVARAAGIERVYAGLTPEDKLNRVRALQRRGRIVAMVGDGVNDAPVLSAADVSIAMQSATQVAQSSADMILLSDDLRNLLTGTAIAGKTLRIIRQNLVWAVMYNLIALPAAALGYVAPWMAAIGMSTSSLIVVANAMRLSRRPRDSA